MRCWGKLGILMSLGLVVCAQVSAEIIVSDVWARESVPGTSSSVMFATLQNTSRKPVQLVGVTVQGVDKAELHTHTEDAGMMRMRRLDAIDIGPRATVKLAPGGFHIMLFQVKTPLVAGQDIAVQFSLSNKVKIDAVAVVVGPGHGADFSAKANADAGVEEGSEHSHHNH